MMALASPFLWQSLIIYILRTELKKGLIPPVVKCQPSLFFFVCVVSYSERIFIV